MIEASSPILGQDTQKSINITEKLANGEIGFFDIPVERFVDEPDVVTGRTSIELILLRDGVFEQAEVYWLIRSDNPFFTDADISRSDGVVTFPKGLILLYLFA